MTINHKKVARIMRENGLICQKRKRKWVRTTDSNHRFRIYSTLIKDFDVNGINQIWVADATYIHILVCLIYLALVMDIFSRKVIGYALSRNIDTQLCPDALHMAINDRDPRPGCIHHLDRGIQYASAHYVKELGFYGFKISMSRKGNPFDNAYAEGLIKTIKTEEVYLWEYHALEDVQRRIPYFIEDVCNQKRLHSSLGCCPPL